MISRRWILKKNRQNTFDLNLRLFFQGSHTFGKLIETFLHHENVYWAWKTFLVFKFPSPRGGGDLRVARL
jgi:hypothetical protein